MRRAKKWAYYNEHDPKAAEWLRELIKAGAISDGEVDERSIEDVLPADLNGFTRCHFFAGIGVWDYALNGAGFTGNVWTGSCPCQPFSAAGKGEGFADERHLWPAWFHLIEVCRPDTIFGEQVSSADGTTWLDLVHSDLEGIGYRIGTLDIPSASVGAPHRRQRLYFVADTQSQRRQPFPVQESGSGRAGMESPGTRPEFRAVCEVPNAALAVTNGRNAGTERQQRSGEQRQQPQDGGIGFVVNAECERQQGRREQYTESGRPFEIRSNASVVANAELSQGPRYGRDGGEGLREQESTGSARAGSVNGFWSDAEWLYCRDGKYRPTKPGIFPLANGIAGRVGLLRGYGNAINGEQAKAFIESYLDL